ncbi:hypothetical protein BGZ72_005510, partial [Mortierella alpina]
MRNGTSSAVDQSQSGTPVYRGPVPPRTSSLDVMDDLSNVNDGRPSLDKERERMRTSSHNSDHDHTQFVKFSSRRSLAWYQSLELQIVSAITVLALIVRLWAIGYPTSVV